MLHSIVWPAGGDIVGCKKTKKVINSYCENCLKKKKKKKKTFQQIVWTNFVQLGPILT